MRARRVALSLSERSNASMAIARRIARANLLRRGMHIAVYVAFDGEVDLMPLVSVARRMGCIVYVPRIIDRYARRMDFIRLPRYTPRVRKNVSPTQLRMHPGGRIHPRQLDMVFTPLIAFDAHGWRLGFGGGFYDRNFAFLRSTFRNTPRLIGIAYAFQEISPTVAAAWDVPLDSVITERGVIRCRAKMRT